MTTSLNRARKSFSPDGLKVRYFLRGARQFTLEFIDLTFSEGRHHMAAQLRELRAKIRKEREQIAMRARRGTRPPCPHGRTHTWIFVRNEVVHSQSIGPEHLRVDKGVRGIYECACGESKFDVPGVKEGATS